MENALNNSSDVTRSLESRPAGALLPNSDSMIKSQARLVILIALAVFVCEAAVMLVLSILPPFPIWLVAIFDATLLIVILSPLLYFCLFRTLVRHIYKRRQVEADLISHRDHLDEKVAERTVELTTANQKLKMEIAERKRAESELRLSEERVRQIANNLPLLIASVDADRRYRFLNREYEHRYGISPPEYVGGKVRELFGPDGYETIRRRIDTVLSGKPVAFEAELTQPGATSRHYFVQFIPDFLPGRQIAGFFMVAQDISSSKKAEADLQRELEINSALSELYRSLISPDASIEDIAYTVLGMSQNLTGSEHGFVSSIDPETGDNVNHTFTEMMKDQCRVSAGERITFPFGRDGHYHGLWGHALNTAEAFYTNSPQDYLSSEGLPNGHIPIENFISVPVVLGEELVGQIALANKVGGYASKDLEAIVRVAELYALVIQKHRAGEALRQGKDQLEKRVADRTAELFEANKKLTAEIKDRSRLQEQLEQSKSRLQAVVDGISEPLVLLGEDMVVKLLNRTAAEYYSLAEYKDILNSKCHQMLRASAAPCEGCEVPAAIPIGQSHRFERRGFMDPDRLEQVHLYPVREKGGGSQDLLLRICDITEQRMFEKQLIHGEKLSSLGVLVSSIAHEINNPNSFIGFNIPILKDYLAEILPIVDDFAADHPAFEICHMAYPEFRKDIVDLLANIEHGSGRISKFVANLKEFSRVKERVEEVWMDLTALLEKVLSICHVQLKKNVKSFLTNIPENPPRIWSDPLVLEQVLLNLLVNAAQAADKIDSRVELKVEVRPSWLDHIILEVKDNGAGMDEKTRQKIFDPFFTTKSPAGGTGLGLYVSDNLVRSIRGRIEVESEPGKGSTFRIVLPDKERRSQQRL